MFRLLLLLFIVVPLAEFALLYQLSVHTSLSTTIALVLLTGVVGAWLARREGLRVWRSMQEELSRGQVPSNTMLDTVMIFAAGVLLVTPGVLTDLAGVTLLIPPCRAFYKRVAANYYRSQLRFRTSQFSSGVRQPGHRPTGSSQIIDSYVVNRRSKSEPK